MKKKSVCLTALLLGLFLMAGLLAGIYGKQEASAAEKGTVTTDGLRVRTGAGTDKAVLTCKGANVMLSKGATVTIQSEKTVGKVIWYKVSFTYQGEPLTGYVSGDYVKAAATSQPDDADTAASDTSATTKVTISRNLSIPAKITADSVNVRKGASTSGSRLTVDGKSVALKKSASVKIIKEIMNGSQKWYYVSFTYDKVTKKGYILSDYAQLVLTRDISANLYGASTVKLRAGAGTDKGYKKIDGKTASVKKGAEVLIIKETKDAKGAKWFKVECVCDGALTRGFVPAGNIVLNKVVPIQGKVTADNLRVRTGAGTSYAQVAKNGAKVLLQKGQMVTVTAQTKVSDVTWYKVTFDYDSEKISGYISGDYVKIVEYTLDTGTTASGSEEKDDTGAENTGEGNNSTDNTDAENNGSENNGSENNNGTDNGGTDKEDEGNTDIPEAEIITDIDAFLADQGFPESYKEALKTLHKAHPTWVFKAYHTGLSWDAVIEKESKAGLNLITNNKANGWKSYEGKAYNYATDKFTVYDGSTWVTASKEAVAYYMDPRNFMTERGIFQFLTLEYQREYESRKGVEAVLANTPLYNREYTYVDWATGQEVAKLYSDTFMEAAKKSGVSSYHLATRVKQEVVSNSTTLSGSATGNFSGYEGYYNFYNIGATHSTAAGGAIANGLSFAMGNKSADALKEAYMLPWNNQYKAIVGGASYIGSQYINRGQNTIYLQKFNVTPTSTYSHQYMANVEAANSEAIKLYNGYTSVLDTSLVFYIPVYENMPKEKASVPGSIPSPNNWLKSLAVDDYVLTPEFDAAMGSSQVYVLSLDTEDVESVAIKAVTANSKASVAIRVAADGKTQKVSDTGSAEIKLITGENEVEIVVTAENGNVNTYKLTITK